MTLSSHWYYVRPENPHTCSGFADQIAANVTETIKSQYDGIAYESEAIMEIKEELENYYNFQFTGIDRNDPELISEIMFWVSCETY